MSHTARLTIIPNPDRRASKSQNVTFIGDGRIVAKCLVDRSGLQGQAQRMADRNLMRNRAALGRDRTLDGRRSLDLAQGILIGFRRYRAEAAFEELITVAQKHGVSVSALALALIALVTGTTDETGAPREAVVVADLAWGNQLD